MPPPPPDADLVSPDGTTASAMKTLVTGATGFLGSHVARQLAETRRERARAGAPVKRSARARRTSTRSASPGICAIAASLDRALAGVPRVFHVAADYRLWARDPREIYESNVTGTQNLARCRAAGRR